MTEEKKPKKLFGFIKRKSVENKEYVQNISGWKDIKKGGQEIYDMAQVFKNKPMQGKTENFQDAKKRLNVSDKDLMDVYKFYSLTFYGSLIILLFSLFFFSYGIFTLSLTKILGGIAGISIGGANSFQYSFRCFQLKHQKLCSKEDWFKRKHEWFPKIMF